MIDCQKVIMGPTVVERNTSRPKILYVEDDVLQGMLVTSILSARGYDVQTAPDGAEGVKQALRWQPDLILMDIMMPEMNGFEATRALRANKNINGVPILALTAKNDEETHAEAKAAGMNEVLLKPFMPEELLQKLTAYLPQYQEGR